MIGESKDRYKVDLFNRAGNKGAAQRPGPQAVDPKGGPPAPSEATIWQCHNSQTGEYYEEYGDLYEGGSPKGNHPDWSCAQSSIE